MAMNPNASEYFPKPGASQFIQKKSAWSNPAKSVHVAKLPQQRQSGLENRDLWPSLVPKAEPRVLHPVVILQDKEKKDDTKKQASLKDHANQETNSISLSSSTERMDRDEWEVVGKKVKRKSDKASEEANNGNEPKDEENLEVLRQQRRERRQRAKEAKRKHKEELKRIALQGQKDTKITVVGSDILKKVMSKNSNLSSSASKAAKDKIKFFEEEYPSLTSALSSKKEIKKSYSSIESGSEWETEDECDKTSLMPENSNTNEEENEKIEVVSSYVAANFSSILKKPKAIQSVAPNLLSQKSEIVAKAAVVDTSKKVKKKDPITIDIFQALTSKKTFPGKTVLGSKLNKASVHSAPRNMLDSSAPTKRRGKEREKPKKKHHSTIKKIILLEKQSRLALRLANLELSKKAQCEHSGKAESVEEAVKHKSHDNRDTDSLPLEKIPSAQDRIELPQLTTTEKAKLTLHSRKFRDYCDHDLSTELDEFTGQLIKDIVRFQDRQFEKDPIKAKAKKRYVVGLREIKKFLQVKKISILILAPDVELVKSKGGLDDVINELISLARENEIPYVFSMNRWKLGKTCYRKVPISGIGVLNHQGSDDNFKKIRDELLPVLKASYADKLAKAIKNIEG